MQIGNQNMHNISDRTKDKQFRHTQQTSRHASHLKVQTGTNAGRDIENSVSVLFFLKLMFLLLNVISTYFETSSVVSLIIN